MIEIPGHFAHVEELKLFSKDIVGNFFDDLAKNSFIADNIEKYNYYKGMKSDEKLKDFLEINMRWHLEKINDESIKIAEISRLYNAFPEQSRAYSSLVILPEFTRPVDDRNDSYRQKGISGTMMLPGAAQKDNSMAAGSISPALGERMDVDDYSSTMKSTYVMDPINYPFLKMETKVKFPDHFKREIIVKNWIKNDKTFVNDRIFNALFDQDFFSRKKEDMYTEHGRSYYLDPDKISYVYDPILASPPAFKSLESIFDDPDLNAALEKRKATMEFRNGNARIENTIRSLVKKERSLKLAWYRQYPASKRWETLKNGIDDVNAAMEELMRKEGDRSVFMNLTASLNPSIVRNAARKALIGASNESNNSKIVSEQPLDYFLKKLNEMVSLNKKVLKSLEKTAASGVDLDDMLKTAEFTSGIEMQDRIYNHDITGPVDCTPYQSHLLTNPEKLCMALGSLASLVFHIPSPGN
jgi:hypothetical protein